jgi:NAD(P)-dependent dehydrogenase (short-subunit alcohol dehydrogenase family)
MAVVMITGCTSGIGFESALAFARSDTGSAPHRVYACVRNPQKADSLGQLAGSESLDIRIKTLDVTAPSSFAGLVQEVIAESGRIDVLVNNAGILHPGAWEDLAEEKARAVMETNFFGPMLLSRTLLPQMRKQGSGYIIMVSSLSGIAGLAGDVAYTASKFALEGATEALRHEVDRWGIHLALVQGGQYATGIFDPGAEQDCEVSSPYRPLIEFKKCQVREGLASGAIHPKVMAQQLVEIANSDGSQLRWPADDLAKRVLSTTLGQTDRERDEFLQMAGGSQWWSAGLPPPE